MALPLGPREPVTGPCVALTLYGCCWGAAWAPMEGASPFHCEHTGTRALLQALRTCQNVSVSTSVCGLPVQGMAVSPGRCLSSQGFLRGLLWGVGRGPGPSGASMPVHVGGDGLASL